jgi:hypothetical protein
MAFTLHIYIKELKYNDNVFEINGIFQVNDKYMLEKQSPINISFEFGEGMSGFVDNGDS